MIELGKLLIDEETASAFSAWLHALVEKRRKERERTRAEQEQEAQNDVWYEKLRTVARGLAEEHGRIAWMDAEVQAQAAYDAWDASAGYLDIDEHFQLDAEWQESWKSCYMARLDEA